MTGDLYKREGRHCGYCNKYIYGNFHNYKSHLFQHNAVKPRHVCDVCTKPYFRKDTFSRHMHHHLKLGETTSVQFKYNVVKGFICDYCKRSFKDKRNLINHLKIHDDAYNTLSRIHKCRACNVSYCEERLLKVHIRKEHFNLVQKENDYDLKKLNETWLEQIGDTKTCVQMTKVKPNVISIKKCKVKMEIPDERKGLNLIELNDISHYSKAVCDYCKKEMIKKSLIKHIKERHWKLRKYSCKNCKRTFKRQYQLKNHECKKRLKSLKQKNSFEMYYSECKNRRSQS